MNATSTRLLPIGRFADSLTWAIAAGAGLVVALTGHLGWLVAAAALGTGIALPLVVLFPEVILAIYGTDLHKVVLDLAPALAQRSRALQPYMTPADMTMAALALAALVGALVETRCQGQERLARARLARQRHELHVVLK